MIFESEGNADKLKFVLFGFQGKLLPLFILFAEWGCQVGDLPGASACLGSRLRITYSFGEPLL